MFAAIIKKGLSPDDFQWSEGSTRATTLGLGRPTPMVPVLVHRPSAAYFAFDYDFNDRSHCSFYAPGAERLEDQRRPGDWAHQLEYVSQWLDNLKREHETPNLWQGLHGQGGPLGDPLPEIENSLFTSREQARIEERIEEARRSIRESYQLTDEQHDVIEEQLDYLVDASKRLGRVDWRNAFLGALVSVFVQAAVPPEPVRYIIEFTLRGLAHLFALPTPTLPAP